MVYWIPLIAGGTILGAALSSFFAGGGTKKEAAIETGPETHAPYEHYAPVDVVAPVTTYQYDYTVVSDSPFASVVKDMRTGVESAPYIAPSRYEYDPIGIEQLDEGQGQDIMKIVAIVGVAYIGGQYLKGK